MLGAPPHPRPSDRRTANHRKTLSFCHSAPNCVTEALAAAPTHPWWVKGMSKRRARDAALAPPIHRCTCPAAVLQPRSHVPACLHPCTHLAPCLLCRSAGCAPAALQAKPSQAPARAMTSCTLCKRALGLLCALLRTAEIPLNELFSKIFGRCARQVVEDGACGAGLQHSCPPPRARMLHSFVALI